MEFSVHTTETHYLEIVAKFRAISPCRPLQELRDTVDLVVMSPIWKCQQFKQEGVEPVGFAREMDVSGFDLGGLRHHAIHLAPLRLPTDGAWHSPRQIAPEILQERHAGAGILDQDGSGTVLRCQARELAPKIRVLEPGAEHVDEGSSPP